MTDTLHRIDITISHGHIDHRFSCTGTGQANCHLVCPAGCDEWSGDHVKDMRESYAGEQDAEAEAQLHALVDGGECNLISFLSNDEAELEELYEGPPLPFMSGAVTLSYNGEYVTWSYVKSDPTAVKIEGLEA